MSIFPDSFSNHKLIKKFEKPRAHDARAITFDGQFITVIHYRKKSGKVKDTETIIKKDLDNWIKWFKTLGWKEVN